MIVTDRNIVTLQEKKHSCYHQQVSQTFQWGTVQHPLTPLLQFLFFWFSHTGANYHKGSLRGFYGAVEREGSEQVGSIPYL